MSKTLLRGATVLTLAPKAPNHPAADVLVEGDRIAAVGPDLRDREAVEVDATNAIVMPGFVDGHHRTSSALFRAAGGEGPPDRAPALDPDDRYASTLLGILTALEAGTTTITDWVGDRVDEDGVAAVLRAHADAGVRSIVVTSSTTAESTALTTIAFASGDLVAGSDVATSWRDARSRGVRIHARAGLAPGDVGVVASLGRVGLLGPDVTLVHGTHLGDDDLDAVAEHRVSVVVTPSTEMNGGMGSPPLQKFLDRKIAPGLGVGDARLSPGDMLAQMRLANSLQHASYFDLKLAGKAGLPNLLTTRDVIRYATIEGAAAIGQAGSIGSIEPGKQADLLVIRTDRPNVFPINDPIGAVVWAIDPSNIDLVFVAGRRVVVGGEAAVDFDHVRQLVAGASERVARRSEAVS